MATLVSLGDIAFFVAGGAVVWFFKEPLLKWWKGAEDYAAYLKEKAENIRAKF